MIMSQIAFAPVPVADGPFGLATMLARRTRLPCSMTNLGQATQIIRSYVSRDHWRLGPITAYKAIFFHVW
jgi:hypothetical protein